MKPATLCSDIGQTINKPLVTSLFTIAFTKTMTSALFLFGSDIDFSFAICPKRLNDCIEANQQTPCIRRTSAYQELRPPSILLPGRRRVPNSRDLEGAASDNTSPLDSCRTVTFVTGVVTEVKSVPRYEIESKMSCFTTPWIYYASGKRLD